MEGCAGLTCWNKIPQELEQKVMTEELNAAIRGAFDGGATEVVVGESHGGASGMRNIRPDILDGRARHIAGQPKPLNHMCGIDRSFDLALFIGYHAKAGTLHAVMAHTYALNIFSLSVNGVETGEIAIDSAICGSFGVPVGLVAGDRAACEEAKSLLPSVNTVSVKEGISQFAADCLSREQAHSLIQEKAAESVRNASAFKPFAFKGNSFEFKVTFMDPASADSLEHLPFTKRVDGRSISFMTEDFLKGFEIFNSMHFLAKTNW